MARTAAGRPPTWMLLLLAICLTSLAVHFYAESLAPAAAPSTFFVSESPGHFDDHFVQAPDRPVQEHGLLVSPAPEAAQVRAVFGLLPLLPPPNS